MAGIDGTDGTIGAGVATAASTIGAGAEATVLVETHGGALLDMDTIEDFMATVTEVLPTIEEDVVITIEMPLQTIDQEQHCVEDLI